MARYDLLAIDLDGTLLDPGGRVSRRNVEAVHAARAAGVRVVVCTGRGLDESRAALEAIDQRDVVVVAGGSMLACPVNRRTEHRFSLDGGVVRSATERLHAHGYPVMVLKDALSAGYDYLMVLSDRRYRLDPVTEWWLREMNVRARYAEHLHEDEHPEHTIRLGVCGPDDHLAEVSADLRAALDERVVMHHFPAVVAPEHAARFAGGRTLHVLEVFDAQAGKWNALQWLAARDGIEASRIAAIGDQINDVSMVRGAGLGIAMDNAVPEVKAAAGRGTASNAQDGVALAIDRILTGEW